MTVDPTFRRAGHGRPPGPSRLHPVGMVAMACATRHPQHPQALVLVSTTVQAASHVTEKVALFGRLGGTVARELAHRRFVLGDTSPEVLAAWLKVAMPLYTLSPAQPGAANRIKMNTDATAWFNRVEGEGRHFGLHSR
jgi:pimeloyl-ACP methyl ester carboxylesterase